MPWTLQHGATTQSLSLWGLSGAVVTLRSFSPSTLSFQCAAEFDGAALFDYGDTLTLRDPDNVVQFIGRVRQLPASAGGGAEAFRYVAEDCLGDLSRRVFGQTWQNLSAGVVGDGISARVVLFDDGGASQTVQQTVQAIVAAAVAAGVSVQMGDADGLTISPRKVDVKGVSFLECLKAACVYSPDVSTQVDYTTTPPTLHFIRRADATAHSLPVLDSAESFEITPLYDQRIEGVYLAYEKRGTLDGVDYLSLDFDIYPVETVQTGERVLFQTLALQGASGGHLQQTQTQDIVTRSIDQTELDWWEKLLPHLVDRNEAAALSEITVKDSAGDTTSAHKELLSGVVQPWMAGTTELITITALFNGLINGEAVINQKLTVQCVSTTLATNTYTNLTSSAGTAAVPDEDTPVGIAESYYNALHPLPWQGRWHRIASEVPHLTIKPGDVINFTGTENADLSTAAAQVQQVSWDIHQGTVSLEFGRPDYLAPQDFIQLLHEQRKLAEGNKGGQRNSGELGGEKITQQGPSFSPNTSASAGPSIAVHPFKITKIGTTGHTFRVEAGTFDGQPIASQTVSIGTTRPYGILIKPEYTLTKWGAQHVYSAALRTDEDHVPVLTGSTSELASVITLDDGTEARCIIAKVLAGDVVEQYATGNVTSQVGDSGRLAGTATVSFNTAA